MCPPVPPPAISRRIVPLPSFDRLARDREEDPDRGEADDEGRAAVADERQRDPRNRDERHDDADVDERLEAEPRRDARRQQSPERVRRPKRRSDARVAEDEKEHYDKAAADQPELLADDRKDEVVERVRQEEPAGEPALAEARADESSEPEREQTLDRVEALAERIDPRVEPRLDAVHLVAAESDDDDGHDGHPAHRGEMREVGAGDEEHRERGQRDDGGRAEVGLLEDERDHRRDDDEERDGSAPEAADGRPALGDPVRDV